MASTLLSPSNAYLALHPATDAPLEGKNCPLLEWERYGDGASLRVHDFEPEGHTPEDNAPCVVFYHGGMWMLTSAKEIAPWAHFVASQGAVCLVPEFRTRNNYDVLGEDIVQDGLDMWNWVQHYAPKLGIDAERVTLAGADAGGLLALLAAMPRPLNERRWWHLFYQPILPTMPASVAIFRGVVDVNDPEAMMLNLQQERLETASMNPAELLRRDLPPLFCVHGQQDRLQSYESSEWFCDEWRSWGNEAEFLLIAHADHTLMRFEVSPQIFEHVSHCWRAFMQQHKLWDEKGESNLQDLLLY